MKVSVNISTGLLVSTSKTNNPAKSARYKNNVDPQGSQTQGLDLEDDIELEAAIRERQEELDLKEKRKELSDLNKSEDDEKNSKGKKKDEKKPDSTDPDSDEKGEDNESDDSEDDDDFDDLDLDF